jgi:hypothetical protein
VPPYLYLCKNRSKHIPYALITFSSLSNMAKSTSIFILKRNIVESYGYAQGPER